MNIQEEEQEEEVKGEQLPTITVRRCRSPMFTFKDISAKPKDNSNLKAPLI